MEEMRRVDLLRIPSVWTNTAQALTDGIEHVLRQDYTQHIEL